MKIRTSYFYQIRNFNRNMIPISTAIWDPSWFHNFTGDYNFSFYDKRNIINGLRCNTIIEQGKKSNHGSEICPCENKDYSTCSFLSNYRNNLENIDFNKLYDAFEELTEWYAKENNLHEEIIIVLIVYETPINPCSERKPLQDYFNSHGIECKELDYPINNLVIQKNPVFDF